MASEQTEEAGAVAVALTLADILEKLFQTVRRPNGKKHSAEEVANWASAWLQERGKGTFSKQYLLDLRAGKKKNPTKSHLEALAAFFDVDPALFLNSERSKKIQADLDLALAIREGGVAAIALRTVSLSPADQQKVLEFVQSLPSDGDD